MTYVPVNLETREVHRHLHENHPSDETTVCGYSGAWVRSMIFVKESDPLCPICYSEGF
jgi:hypothetical protein